MRPSRLVHVLAASVLLASCGVGGGGGGGGGGPIVFNRYALVVEYSGVIRRYAVDDATGRLHPGRETTPVTDPGEAVLNPDRSRLYLINNGGDASISTDDSISVYDVGADASLTEIAGSPFSGVDKWPTDLAMHPSGLFLYVLNSNFRSKNVTQFAVDPATGALTEIGTEVPTGDSGSDITIDGTGAYAYVSNVSSNDVSQYEILPDGTLSEVGTAIAAGDFPTWIVAHPTEPYVYTANSNDGTITQFQIGADGTLTEIGSRIEVKLTGNPPEPQNGLGEMVIHPSGNWLYIPHFNSGPRLYQYEILADGTLSEIGIQPDVGSNAVYTRMDPTGRYLYVIGTGDQTISTFEIDVDGTAQPVAPGVVQMPDLPRDILFLTGDTPLQPVPTFAYATDTTNDEVDQFTVAADGSFSALGSDAAGDTPFGIAATFDGRFVYVVDEANDQVLPFAANAAGELSALTPADTGDIPGHVVVSPSGRFAYVLDAGDDTVSQYTIASDGTLSDMPNPTAATSTDPVHMAIHPSGRYFYVVHAGTKNVWGYRVILDYFGSSNSGQLSVIGAKPQTGNAPTWIAVHPNGDFAYVTNQDDDTVQQHAVGYLGQLSNLTPHTVATGDAPASIVIEPSGRFAYVANTDDNTISQYTVGADGQLAPFGTPVAAGTAPTVLRTDPGGRFVYAVTDGQILRFTINNDGSLTPAAGGVGMNAKDLVVLGTWE